MEDRQIFTQDIRRTLVVLAIMAALILGMVLISRHTPTQASDPHSGSSSIPPAAISSAAQERFAPLALLPHTSGYAAHFNSGASGAHSTMPS